MKIKSLIIEGLSKTDFRAWWMEPRGNLHEVYTDAEKNLSHYAWAYKYFKQNGDSTSNDDPSVRLLNLGWIRITFNYYGDKYLHFDYHQRQPSNVQMRNIEKLASEVGAEKIKNDISNREVALFENNSGHSRDAIKPKKPTVYSKKWPETQGIPFKSNRPDSMNTTTKKNKKKVLSEGALLDYVTKKIKALEKEWEELDSQGVNHHRQAQIGRELQRYFQWEKQLKDFQTISAGKKPKVHELFDSPYHTHSVPDETSGPYNLEQFIFDADGTPYRIYFLSRQESADLWNKRHNANYKFKELMVNIINVEFSKGSNRIFIVSPHKQYLKVLATVLGEIMKKMKKFPDAILAFSSSSREESRIKLYDRMVEKFTTNDYLLDTEESFLVKLYSLIPKRILKT